MDKDEIREMLEQHRLWINHNGGERIDLYNADLRNADLHKADLRGANLRGADLRRANLYSAWLDSADLSFADLRYANLHNAELHNANLYGANLSDADLHSTDLSCTDLGWANLYYADLSYVNLYGANLLDANLHNACLYGGILYNVKYNSNTNFFALQCPEEGSFIGYKKAGDHIVKLEILSNAKRSSATSRKCRCSAAKVLSITTLDGKDDGTQFVSSDRDNDFMYQVGEIVRVDDFDENRWNECSTGIHFFITRDEAVEYGYC